jgi:hypothetical protein
MQKKSVIKILQNYSWITDMNEYYSIQCSFISYRLINHLVHAFM